MERIRAALGDEKLTFAGFSYGTYLGALYAEHYPDRVRALLLDGAIDPSVSIDDVQIQQAKGFEASLDAFLARLRARHEVCVPSRRQPEGRARRAASPHRAQAAEGRRRPQAWPVAARHRARRAPLLGSRRVQGARERAEPGGARRPDAAARALRRVRDPRARRDVLDRVARLPRDLLPRTGPTSAPRRRPRSR